MDNQPPKLYKVSDVTGFSVSLSINEKRALYVLLDAHGSINRQGDGTIDSAADNPPPGLFIGVTDPSVFHSVLTHLTDDILEFLGRVFRVPNPVGAQCKLALLFHFNDDASGGLEFHYGAESQGPPQDIADFVTAAVRETDSWYELFKESVRKS